MSNVYGSHPGGCACQTRGSLPVTTENKIPFFFGLGRLAGEEMEKAPRGPGRPWAWMVCPLLRGGLPPGL